MGGVVRGQEGVYSKVTHQRGEQIFPS